MARPTTTTTGLPPTLLPSLSGSDTQSCQVALETLGGEPEIEAIETKGHRSVEAGETSVGSVDVFQQEMLDIFSLEEPGA